MALPPQKFREIVLQVLFSRDFISGEEEEMIPFMMNELKVTKRIMLDVHARVDSILGKLDSIDAEIRTASTEYSFERISRVERTILRLGLFELHFDTALPAKVVIAEAIRLHTEVTGERPLCRKFGTPESASYINAILDGVYKKNGSETPEPALAQ